MRTIENIRELRTNLELFERYLCEGSDSEKYSVGKLVVGGKCFVSYKIGNEWRFAPSRFVGYFNNDLETHASNTDKDGRETNPAINKIAENKLAKSELLEQKYKDYCESIGINFHDKNRKYWLFGFGFDDFIDNSNTNGSFPEGKIVERRHKSRERNSELIESAKKIFWRTHGKLFCQICNFDFERIYGDLGRNFIEAHHTVPVSEMKEGHLTTIDEIAFVCSNCHRMLHRRRPWLNIDNIKKIIK
jgi:hypothetical protein